MIAKARRSAGRSRRREPLDIKLTLAFRFGDEPEDHVTVMNDRSIPLVGTVFESRDRILRGFSRLLFKAAAQKPKVVSELVPLFKLLGGRGRRKKKAK
ncbi:MAG: hypothetical protein JWQ90_3163 [Hydrocarboniphaga sp.]|uniref:hypothetical protein n=1 Tax=Hydrocarboniphaga sp. TaxID=2033016 RepID=UPI00261F711D|nr:hypothetical protein [Hydrocarboniphaga sp.]MDB5970713.1 hypothetical protein [Hydrocarboniphaga sp.]